MSDEVLTQLEARLSQLLKVVEREEVKSSVRGAEREKLSVSMGEKQHENVILLQVVELFKSLGGMQEEDLLLKLEKFISYGLSAVFGVDYSFVTKMRYEGKDLKVDFYVQTGGLQSDVTGAKGGGVAEVVSMLMQIFFVIVLKDVLVPVLIMDTAMVHLSRRYHAAMSELLKELCDKMGIQVILMAHSGEFGEYADCLYHFKQSEGKTIVEKVK